METLEIEVKAEIRVYDVTIDGTDVNFSANVDADGDIRIEVEEGGVVEYLKNSHSKETLKELFEIE